MAKRVCCEDGCPTLIEVGTSRCPKCARIKDAARGTSTERGYGAEFEAAKKTRPYVSATRCVTCGEPFTRDNPKTAGHVNAIRTYGPNDAGVKPECRKCNMGWRRTGS